jgi:hypothetical protein
MDLHGNEKTHLRQIKLIYLALHISSFINDKYLTYYKKNAIACLSTIFPLRI